MHPAAIQSRPLVVVADDSSDMRSLIKEVLEGDGYEVIPAASGARALTEMTARRPDLLITDLLMPGMTGFILRGLMLRRPELASIPVIILSAYRHRPSDTLDVAEVLTKPLNIDRLIEVVRRLAPIGAPTRTMTSVPIRPSGPEISEPDGGPRPPRPSQAEGPRETPVR